MLAQQFFQLWLAPQFVEQLTVAGYQLHDAQPRQADGKLLPRGAGHLGQLFGGGAFEFEPAIP